MSPDAGHEWDYLDADSQGVEYLRHKRRVLFRVLHPDGQNLSDYLNEADHNAALLLAEARDALAAAESRIAALEPLAALGQEALAVIEGIVSDDECADWEMLSATRKLRGRAKAMEYKLSEVYRIAHSSVASHSCYDVHDGWRAATKAAYDEATKAREQV